MWLSRVFALCSVILLLSVAGPSQATAEEAYRLAPLDKLQIKIVEWKADLGESRDWSPINGEYEIDAAGSVSIPFIGSVAADGRTTEELSRTISNDLRKILGLSGYPQASVSIAEYRPVFITGQVQQPGKYPYFPGMTVLKLVSVAGGTVTKTDPAQTDNSALLIRYKGELDQLLDERVALLAVAARLEAEIAGDDTITFPDSITTHPDFEAIAAGEETLKKTRKSRLERELLALESLKVILNSQIESLGKRDTSLKEQEALAKAEMASVSSLKEKGLTVNSRIRAAHQALALTQANLLTTETDTLRARQEINKADRDGENLVNDWRTELATRQQEVDGLLRVANIKIKLTRDLMSAALLTGGLATDLEDSDFELVFTILRDRNGTTTEFKGTEGLSIEPGDLVKVDFQPVAPEISSN
ncbi:MAG: polysaccharide biosynthesis/export family protein [Pseudomonadota bacterium]